MPEGIPYTPKFKIGQTVLSTTEWQGMEFVIFSTYKGLSQFSPDYARNICPREFDESESSNVMYVGWHSETLTYYWLREDKLTIYCNNTNRGKKILLEPNNFRLIKDWFTISGEGLEKFKAILNEVTPQ